MKMCRICDSPLNAFLDLGLMPRANGFLSEDEFSDEISFPLAAAYCGSCTAVQLIEQPPADILFPASYPFLTGSSSHMKIHFEKLAEDITARFLSKKSDPLVVEIGSNDGTMLKNFAEAGCRHLGLEPAAMAAAKARTAGVMTQECFFNEQTASEIQSTHGRAHVLIGTNVFCHINTIRSAAGGVRKLLAPDGIAVFEDPYLIDMLEKTAYDQIYDEHVFIFSVTALKNLFEKLGLEIVDVARIPTHGGSIRYWVAHRGAYPVSTSVDFLLQEEIRCGIQKFETYDKFRNDVTALSVELKTQLQTLKQKGFRIAGYGATSKSTTVLNHAAIGPGLIEYISDTTKYKQGKFSPGMHIPIVSPDRFRSPYPDFAVLFAWNHAGEIMEKEREFVEKGGKWILPVPRVEIKP